MSDSAPDRTAPTARGGCDPWTFAFAAAGILAVWAMALTAADPLFLAPFREAQTAISADWLLREPQGGMLGYQTPIFGEPWRLPLEFPLFQQLTAWVAAAGIGVAQAGRVVNLLCWAGCLATLVRLLPEWGLPRRRVAMALALVAAAPLHSAYALAHLIEPLALWAALLHLWAFWRCARGAGPGWWLLAAGAGAAVALVKITTWLPAGALTGLLTLKVAWDARTAPQPAALWRRFAGLAAVGLFALAAGLVWSRWSAQVRSANALASAMFAKDLQQAWIFGNLHERLSPKFLGLLAAKHLLLIFGPLGLAVPWLLWRGLRPGPGVDPRLRAAVYIPLAGYAFHAGALFPLHLRHDYYLLGSGVFLAAAAAGALAVLEAAKPGRAWVRRAGPALALSMALGGLVHEALRRGYRDLDADAALAAVKAVQEPGALLTFGLDWSSRVPFAAGRKALMEPDEQPGPKNLAVLDAALAATQSTPFAAAVVVGRGWEAAAAASAARVGLDPSRKFPFSAGGYLLLRTNAVPARDISPEASPELAALALRAPPDHGTGGGLQFCRWPGSGRPGSGFELVVQRDNDAFWVRSDGLQLVRARRYFRRP